jgi:hypothetical protein
MDTIRAKIGAIRRVKLILETGTYTGSETLAASVWPGDDRAALFSPTVAWLDPDARTMSLSWAGSDTSGLAPGRYRLELRITSGGATTKLDVAAVDLLATPGSATAPAAYCTFDDLRVEAGSWVESLQADVSTQAGFAEERGRAREEFDRLVQAHYGGEAFSGIGWPGYTGGPTTFGRSTWLADQLDADALIVTPDVRRWNALWTLYLVCRRQIGVKADSPYQAMAAGYRAEAEALAKGLAAELDTDADGECDVAIPLGMIRTLRG